MLISRNQVKKKIKSLRLLNGSHKTCSEWCWLFKIAPKVLWAFMCLYCLLQSHYFYGYGDFWLLQHKLSHTITSAKASHVHASAQALLVASSNLNILLEFPSQTQRNRPTTEASYMDETICKHGV